MSVFKRLSDNLWAFLSPRTNNPTPAANPIPPTGFPAALPSPQTSPLHARSQQPRSLINQASTVKSTRKSRSSSKSHSSSKSQPSSGAGTKRKRQQSASRGRSRESRRRRIADDEDAISRPSPSAAGTKRKREASASRSRSRQSRRRRTSNDEPAGPRDSSPQLDQASSPQANRESSEARREASQERSRRINQRIEDYLDAAAEFDYDPYWESPPQPSLDDYADAPDIPTYDDGDVRPEDIKQETLSDYADDDLRPEDVKQEVFSDVADDDDLSPADVKQEVFSDVADDEDLSPEDVKQEDESDVADAANEEPTGLANATLQDLTEAGNVASDDLLVLSPASYARAISAIAAPRKLITLPETHELHHVSSDKLRAEGWDDDYITLIQKIALRGHEPLLHDYFYLDFSFFPDGLFAEFDHDAFITSARGDHFRAIKALERLIQLGGRARDRLVLDPTHPRAHPEEQVRQQVNEYIAWANRDADLDMSTALPLLALEVQPAGTSAAQMRANATAKCAALAERHREALRVAHSVEFSPGSSAGTALTYPVPTIYALVASHTLVALMAYRPTPSELASFPGPNETDSPAPVTYSGKGKARVVDSPSPAAPAEPQLEPECEPMAYFDLNVGSYDVWNALALAIVVCHVRNLQIRIAEETGIGMKGPGWQAPVQSDEDV